MAFKSYYSRLNLPIFIFSLAIILLSFLQISFAAKNSGGKPTCNKRAVASAIAPKITSLDVVSSMRIHITADYGIYNGSVLNYLSYSIYNEQGTLVGYFPDMIYLGFLNNINVEGLLPGHSYSVVVRDSTPSGDCVAPAPAVSFKMPALLAEAIAPDVSAPYIQAYSAFIGNFYVIQGLMNDNTGVDSLKISINGKIYTDWHRTDSSSFSYWTDNSANPQVQYDLGHIYQLSIPQELHGTTAIVEVAVGDPFGNITIKSANLYLP